MLPATAVRALATAPVAVVGITLALWLVGPAPARAAGGPSDPLPELDVGGGEKHFRVVADFAARESATLASATVEFGIARARIGNPPLLRVRVLDREGNVLEAFDEWHPLWEFRWNEDGAESLSVKSSGDGELVFPFDPEAALIELTDVALGREVLRGDLTGAVGAFCASHPDDPACELADLRVSDVHATSAPPLVLFGSSESMTVRTVVENAGPDGPVTARVVQSVSAPSGLAVTPSSDAESEVSLAVLTPAELDRSYTLECVTPGLHRLSFTSRIEAVRAATVDPEPSNDESSLEVAVDCSVPVAINVKPGGADNPIQLRSANVPVAILSTRVGEYGLPVAVDATTIEPSSLRFGARESVVSGAGASELHDVVHVEDSLERDERTLDADADAVVHFSPAQTGLDALDAEACVRGRFATGVGAAVGFLGCDTVRVRAANTASGP